MTSRSTATTRPPSTFRASAPTPGPPARSRRPTRYTRSFERAAAQLTALNPYTGNTDSLLFKMADQTGMAAIHMITTGDPARNPTFTYFADDDYYITDFPTRPARTASGRRSPGTMATTRASSADVAGLRRVRA